MDMTFTLIALLLPIASHELSGIAVRICIWNIFLLLSDMQHCQLQLHAPLSYGAVVQEPPLIST